MADKNTQLIGFICQRCCQPVRLDPSFEKDFTDYQLDEAGDENTNKISDKDQCNKYEEDEVDRLIIRSSQEDKVNFDAAEAQAKSYNDKIRLQAKLFDILSSQSEIDHPLCDECAGLLLDFLDQELEAAEVDCRTYSAFLDDFDKDNDEDIEKLQAELENLKAEEEHLQKQLKEGEKERENLLEERQLQKQEASRLDQEEEKFMLEYHSLEKQKIEFENDDRSVDYQMIYAQVQIEKLKRTNIFNSAFHIWSHRGHFGTINNFRLGRLPTVPVEWNEINAAWGQTALLLHCLAKKIGFTFSRYRLVPFGSYSFIEPISDKSRQLTLFCNGGIRYLWNSKFDSAMVAFLDCLQQFKEEVEKHDSGFSLPYKMTKGKIEDSSGSGGSYSIKTQFNSEERWTKALKFMLTNLKWALAWVSSKCLDSD